MEPQLHIYTYNMEDGDQNEPLETNAPRSPLVCQLAMLLSKRRGEIKLVPVIVNTRKYIEPVSHVRQSTFEVKIRV